MKKIEYDADVVVVGTGAGGATAARTLTRAGLDVLMVEEGPDLRSRPTEATSRDAMLSRFRDFGAQTASGPGTRIPLLQGRMVGGSTGINSAIFWRLPEPVWRDWIAADPALGANVTWSEVEAAADEIERDLGVRPVAPTVAKANNLLLQQATESLGLDGRVIRRAETGCEGSGRCLLGCPNKRRAGMDVSYVPQSLSGGAKLLADTRVVRVRLENGRAIGVDVRTREGKGFVRARRAVVLAAGAVHTPWLLLRSGIRGSVGERFTAHPGFSVTGLMNERIALPAGATQGYEVTALRPQGLKIESLGIPRAVLAARVPGTGAAYRDRAASLDDIASWACLVRLEGHGRIKLSPFGTPSASLTFTPRDIARMRVGFEHIVKLFFAAGAREVYPGIAGYDSVLRAPVALEDVPDMQPRRLSMIATHLFGGAVLGTDPARSPVSPAFAVHGVAGLHVADASVIPTTLGVNPQGTIMSLARIAAARIANQTQAHARAA